MFYKHLLIVSLSIYAFFTSQIIGSNVYVSTSGAGHTCTDGPGGICNIYCDGSASKATFDCANAGECYFHCDTWRCVTMGTINATLSNNLNIIVGPNGTECMRSADVYVPNNGNATFDMGDSNTGFSRMKVHAGTNTQNIMIDISSTHAQAGANDAHLMEVHASTAKNVHITIGNGNEWSSGTLECPLLSSFAPVSTAPCFVDASNGILNSVNMYAPDGIPYNFWIIDGAYFGTNTLYCANVDGYNGATKGGSSVAPFTVDSDCWWTANPTLSPTNPIISNHSSYPSVSPINPTITYTITPSNYPSQSPSEAPSDLPTKTPTYPLPVITQCCFPWTWCNDGTKRVCYYVDIDPLVGVVQSRLITIQDVRHGVDTYYDIYVTPANNHCMDPYITLTYESIDYDSGGAYEGLDVISPFGETITTCSSTNLCGSFASCVTNHNLGIAKLAADESNLLVTFKVSYGVDDLCTTSYVINARLTIFCSDATVSPTNDPTTPPTTAPTQPSIDPTKTPTLTPTIPTTTPTKTPNYASPVIQDCYDGTERVCYYVDIAPLPGVIQSRLITIQDTDHGEIDTYYDVYVTPTNNHCVNPSITLTYESIDYDSGGASEGLGVISPFGETITTCSSTNVCGSFASCVTNQNVGIATLAADESNLLVTIKVSYQVDDFCIGAPSYHNYAINARLTIFCSDGTVAPTTVTSDPTTTPTAPPSKTPTQTPTLFPSTGPTQSPTQSTNTPTKMPTYATPLITNCNDGTERVCYYVDIAPLPGVIQSRLIAIQDVDHGEIDTYYDIYVMPTSNHCVDPSITLTYESIDYDSGGASEGLAVIRPFGTTITTCSSTNLCGSFASCVTNQNLGIAKLAADESNLLVTLKVSYQVDSFCTGYAINARLTIFCSDATVPPSNAPITPPSATPTQPSIDPTKNPTLTPTIATTTPTKTPTYASPVIQDCHDGTERVCYYVDIAPLPGVIQSRLITIQDVDHGAMDTYYDIYVTPANNHCVDPYITLTYESIDYDSGGASEGLGVIRPSGFTIATCSSTNYCGSFASCVTNENLGMAKLAADESNLLVTLKVSYGVDDLCTSFYAINARLTIFCSDATVPPTNDPTNEPTQPSATPTKSPLRIVTSDPSKTPTTPATTESITSNHTYCEDTGLIRHLDWNDMNRTLPSYMLNMNVDASDLVLNVELVTDYIGYAYTETDQMVGSAYVFDFAPFHSFEDKLEKPGSCSNRLVSSYEGKTWSEYWQYSDAPAGANQLGSTDYLAYGPLPSYWTLTALDNCATIRYSGQFAWGDLRNCVSFDGDKLMRIQTDDAWINMTGRFYVSVISPHSMLMDAGFYYSSNLVRSYPFQISMKKSIHILNSVGIDVFLFTIFQSSRTFNKTHSNEGGGHMIILSSQSADYMQLTEPNVLTNPPQYNSWAIAPLNHGDCYINSNDICMQFWILYIDNVDCPISFDGEFNIAWTAICNTDNHDDSQCNSHLNNYGNQTVSSINMAYTDPFECDVVDHTLRLSYGGMIRFYTDSSFTQQTSDDPPIYRSGFDVIYVEIEVINLDASLNANLLNVWICAASNNNSALQIMDGDEINSGCFASSLIDEDSFTAIIVNEEPLLFSPLIYNTSTLHNVVRFSFSAPNWLGVTLVYIHSEIAISDAYAAGRRRLLLNDHSTYDPYVHLMTKSSMTSYPETKHPAMPWFTILIIVGCLCIASAILFTIIRQILRVMKRRKHVYSNVDINDNMQPVVGIVAGTKESAAITAQEEDSIL